jgi:hypothetical protein
MDNTGKRHVGVALFGIVGAVSAFALYAVLKRSGISANAVGALLPTVTPPLPTVSDVSAAVSDVGAAVSDLAAAAAKPLSDAAAAAAAYATSQERFKQVNKVLDLKNFPFKL